MDNYSTETSKKSRSVFDAILEWHNYLLRNNNSIKGLEQYTYVLEGMLQDHECERYSDELNDLLWKCLSISCHLDESDDAPFIFLCYLHTLIVWLIHKISKKIANENLIGLPKDFDNLQFDSLRYMRSDQIKTEIINVLGKEKSEETLNEYRNNPSLIKPSAEIIDDLCEILIYGYKSSITLSILNSNFGEKILKTTSENYENLTFNKVKNDNDYEINNLINSAAYITDIRICFLSKKISASQVGRTLWCISTALEITDDVIVLVEDSGFGSFWIDLKVFMKNIWRRDEVQEILEKGREAAVSHYLDRPSEEVQKIEAERQKLDEERALLKQKRLNEPSSKQKSRLIDLEISEKEQEIEGKKLDNSLKRIEIIKKASELVLDGIIEADLVAIYVDGNCHFRNDGHDIESSPIKIEELPDTKK